MQVRHIFSITTHFSVLLSYKCLFVKQGHGILGLLLTIFKGPKFIIIQGPELRMFCLLQLFPWRFHLFTVLKFLPWTKNTQWKAYIATKFHEQSLFAVSKRTMSGIINSVCGERKGEKVFPKTQNRPLQRSDHVFLSENQASKCNRPIDDSNKYLYFCTFRCKLEYLHF